MKIPFSKATKDAIARSVRRSEIEEQRLESKPFPEHTPAPWTIHEYGEEDQPTLVIHQDSERRICFMATPGSHGDPAIIEANAHLICAAPELLEAAELLEKAELAHANCDECEGEDEPEKCPKCFPLFDDARVKRRLAIARATGGHG